MAITTKHALEILGDRRIMIAAPAIAVAAVLSVHHYNPALGLLGNIINGQIYLAEACPLSSSCNGAVPCKFVVLAAVVLLAASWVARLSAPK